MKKLYLTDVEAELLTEALESAWSVLEDKVNGSSNSAFRKYWEEKQAWYEEIQRQLEALKGVVGDEVTDERYDPSNPVWAGAPISDEAIQEVVDEINGQEVNLDDVFKEVEIRRREYPEIRRTEGENWND